MSQQVIDVLGNENVPSYIGGTEEPWTESTFGLCQDWCRQAREKEAEHNRCGRQLNFTHHLLGLPQILLSASVTIVTQILIEEDQRQAQRCVVSILSTLAVVFASIYSWKNPAARSATHFFYESRWSEYAIDIESELARTQRRAMDEFMSEMRARLIDLSKTEPPVISESLIWRIKQKINMC